MWGRLTSAGTARYKHAVSALGSTLGAFGLILVLARLRVPLTAAVLAGTILVGLLLGLGPVELAGTMGLGAVRPITIALAVVTALLLALSEAMRAGRQLEEIVSLARQVLRRPAVSMAALPALIGLVPMPGGALFSAPMVESAAGGGSVSPGRLSAVNYWFRHVWEHWWPLYPGVVLATQLTHSTLPSFAAFQLPLGLCMIASGVVIFAGSHGDLHVRGAAPAPGTWRRLLRATSSIWLIMIVWGIGTLALRLAFGPAPMQLPGRPPLTAGEQNLALAYKFAPITLGLAASLLWTARRNRLGLAGAKALLGSGSIYKLVLLVTAVMVFQHVLKEVGAAGEIARELKGMHVPLLVVVAALPFIAGMVTGLAIGFVGASFPIVVELVGAMPGGPALRPFAALAYACGHLGMMLSPLHLCHVLSNRYFKTPFAPVYRHILPAAGIMAALAAAYFVVLRLAMR